MTLFRRLTLTLLTAGLAALPLAAAEIDIPYEMRVLDNGLTVIVHEDRKAPVIAVNVWYHVGSKNEAPGRTGFAHLFEHLMFQGSENFDGEYLNVVQELGATDINGTTWFDRTNYFQTVPKTALDTVLFMESDRMGHFAGAISQAVLDEQRGVVQNEKRQGENQPYGRVFEAMLPQLFPEGHPYRWETIGSMEDLNAATVEDVREWFETWYGPNNAVLSIAGDIDADEAFARVEKFFGDIEPGPPLTRPQRWIPRHDRERRMVMKDRVPQARVYFAWTGPAWGTDDATRLALAAAILGGDKNSRLYERLVYSDQIASDAALAPLPFEIAGITYLAATAQPGGDLAEVEAAVREEIARFRDKGPTKRELQRVVAQTRAQFLRGIERVGGTSGKSGVLARGMVYAGTPEAYRQQLAVLDSVTPEDLREVAREWLDDNMFVLEVLPQPPLAAAAGGVDRSAGLPVPGEMPAVAFPEFQRFELDNGLKVIVAERHDVPLVQASLLLDAGFAADQFGRPGTSSLAMEMLDEGTSKRSALEIAEDLALLGASVSGGSGLDTSSVQLSTLADNLEPALEIFAEIALEPSFPANELERLRRINLAGIQQEKNRPLSMALRVLPRLMYGDGHPYGQPLTGSGTETDLAAMTRDDLVAFHDTWFRPNHATLVVVGDVETAALRDSLEDLFGDWQPGEIPDKRLAASGQRGGRVLYLLDRPGAEQSVIFTGQLIPPKNNPEELAIQAMNDVLGGKSSARINMNLREDKGWSYGAYSFILDARGQRPLLAYAPVQTDKTAAAVREMQSEFALIVGENPPEQNELETVVRTSTLSLPGRWETGGAVLASLNEIVRFGLPDDYWDGYAERVENLSVDEVRQAADSVLDPDALYWVVVGDRAAVEADLAGLGFDEIRLLDADGNPLDEQSAAR